MPVHLVRALSSVSLKVLFNFFSVELNLRNLCNHTSIYEYYLQIQKPIVLYVTLPYLGSEVNKADALTLRVVMNVRSLPYEIEGHIVAEVP